MSKIKRKVYKVKMLFIMISIFSFCNVVFCKSIIQNSSWYKYADEYIRAHEIMIQHARDKKETFIEDVNLLHKEEMKLLNAPAPPEFELEEFLKSRDPHKRKVALVNIMIKHIYSENLFKHILRSYNSKNDYLERFYSLYCLRILSEEQIRQFEEEILEIMLIEKDEAILMVGMPMIIKMDEAKVFPFFVKSLKNGAKSLRSICYVYLKKMSNNFYEKVKNQLEKEQATDAISFIKNAESGEKPR